MEPCYISLLAIISFLSNCRFRQTEKSAFEVSKLQLKNLANQNISRLFRGNFLLKLKLKQKLITAQSRLQWFHNIAC